MSHGSLHLVAIQHILSAVRVDSHEHAPILCQLWNVLGKTCPWLQLVLGHLLEEDFLQGILRCWFHDRAREMQPTYPVARQQGIRAS